MITKLRKLLTIVIFTLSTTSAIYADSNQSSNWIVTEDGKKAEYRDFNEYIVGDRHVVYLPPIPFDITDNNDFTIEAMVESSETQWNEIGLVFGGEQGNFHFFVISSTDNFYTYGSHEKFDLSDNWKDYLYRLKTDKIKPHKNHLKIKKSGRTLTFYINERTIDEGEFIKSYGKGIGFYMRGGDVFRTKYISIQIE